MLSFIGIALFSLMRSSMADDTVADDIGSHMMGRISELLSPEECQAFYAKLISPEENVNDELNVLSEDRNPIRRRRDITSTEQCKGSLNLWLQTEGDTMYWDCLSRALQAIGRSDVYLELGKNLNQDKNLEIKKNVEDYHKSVKHLTSQLLEENEMRKEQASGQGRLRRQEEASRMELTLGEWDDLELIIDRKPLPPYNRSLFEWVTPVVTGIIGGFLTSFVLVALALYSFFWILHQGSSAPPSPSWNSMPDMIFRSPSPRRGAIYYIHQQLDEVLDRRVSEAAQEDDDPQDEDEDDKGQEKEIVS